MRSYTPIVIMAIGLVLVAVGVLVQQAMPVLGRAAYQAAAAGSYSPGDYRVSLIGYYLVAAVIIALGIVALIQDLKQL